jgi:hypothetical protein
MHQCEKAEQLSASEYLCICAAAVAAVVAISVAIAVAATTTIAATTAMVDCYVFLAPPARFRWSWS